jgi:hypothetical protein
VATKDKAIALAYRCCPFTLIGISKIPDANSMLHTLDSYQSMRYKTKRVHCCAGLKILNRPLVAGPIQIVQAGVAQLADADTLTELNSDEEFELLEILDPSEPKIAPYEINKIENPKTKRAEPSAARPLLLTSVMPAA